MSNSKFYLRVRINRYKKKNAQNLTFIVKLQITYPSVNLNSFELVLYSSEKLELLNFAKSSTYSNLLNN